MKTKTLYYITLTVAILLSPWTINAADQTNSPETKLREALKNTMLQLRDAQNQVATLQAAQADSDAQNAELKSQLAALNEKFDGLTKQSTADKAASDKAIAGLNAQVAQKDSDIAKFTEALEKWKVGYAQILNIAKNKEADRAKLEADNLLLQRTIDDREAKNLALFQLANEILKRYERFGLGDALAAKEPFVGTSRVKLENFVQDYQDKLSAKKVTPGAPLPPPAESDDSKPEPKPDSKPAQAPTTTASTAP